MDFNPTAPSHPKPAPRGELLWAFIDLDGTLAEPVWTPENPTSDIGVPRKGVYLKLMQLHRKGYKIWIYTSRPATDYEAIELWWIHYFGTMDVFDTTAIPLKGIWPGKPLAAIYVDDRARHADADSWLP